MIEAQTGTPANVREFIRRLAPAELKILHAIRFLEEDGTDPTADNIAVEAHLGRSTVYRTLERLTKNNYIAYTLTEQGKQALKYALDPLAESYIRDIPGQQNSRLQESQNGTAQRVNPSQNGTQSQNETTAEIDRSPNVRTQPKDSNVPPPNWETPLNLKAAELAKASHRTTGDNASLGFHIEVWNSALRHDNERRQNHVEAALGQIMDACTIARERTGKPQGAKWNARVREIFRAHQVQTKITWRT